MAPQINPSEIARKALKLLAARKLPPTPVYYQECYNEIARLPNVVGFPEEPLRHIASALTPQNAAQEEQLNLLDSAIRRHSWQGTETALVTFTKESVATAACETAKRAAPATQTLDKALLHQLAHLIQAILPALSQDDPGLPEQVNDLIQILDEPGRNIQEVRVELEIFNRRISCAAEEQGEIKKALLRLLHLIVENISILILEDHWLKGQVGALLETLNQPLSLRHLDEVERRLRDVIHRQTVAKKRSMEAQAEMRQILGTFIEQLSGINQSSTIFQGIMEDSARKIEQVKTIEDLAPLLKEMISATHVMAQDTARAREQLGSLQQKAAATEAEITKLHLELDNASAMARHDPLTKALNRKGLDEALQREIAAMRRKNTALAIALIDIDNFKKLNDRFGHEVGDVALIHLVNMVQEYMRPVDTLARYGGEEFVILLPDTPINEAMTTLARLQRELTKNFFLANNEKVLITFSAGVAQFMPGESQEIVLKRADQAMYLAKRSGKNRVMSG